MSASLSSLLCFAGGVICLSWKFLMLVGTMPGVEPIAATFVPFQEYVGKVGLGVLALGLIVLLFRKEGKAFAILGMVFAVISAPNVIYSEALFLSATVWRWIQQFSS